MADGADRAGKQREKRSSRRGRPHPVFPLAALLFAAAAVLHLFSLGLDTVSFMDIVPALVGSLAFALLVCLIVAVFRRRFDSATAVIASLWIAGALYYGAIFTRLEVALGGGPAMTRSLPLLVVLLIILTVFYHRLPRPLDGVHRMLIGIALVLVAFPVWQVVAYEWRHGDAVAAYDADRAAAGMPQIAGVDASGEDRPPDIYHFIFDRYASAHVLSDHYGIDNPIVDFLEDREFYVAPKSYANYLKTGHSLASTFYLDYIDFLVEDPRVQGANWHPIYSMLEDHRVLRFLKARGYEILQFGSWWTGTFDNPAADDNQPFGFSEFNLHYLRGTVLRPIFSLLPDVPLTMRLDWDFGQCQRVARKIERIKAIGSGSRPVYVFAHILVPHSPYVFAADGRCLSFAESARRGPDKGFEDAVAYANSIIEDVVTALQAEDRRPSVILIQADEGPFPDRDGSIPWQQASAEELRIKTGILNAYYFPNGDYSELRPDISPVNSYRVLFNNVFGTDLPQLPDRIFAFPDDLNLYEFHDVTQRVRCGAGPEDAADDGAQADPRC